MNEDVRKQASLYRKARLRRKRWHRAVAWLSAIVLLGTSYALMHPAITMTRQCGMEAHTHTLECYTQVTTVERRVNVCMEALRDAGPVVHRHDAACFDENGNLWCSLPETEAHQHTEDCYDETGELICEEPTAAEHRHSSACFETVEEPADTETLTCTNTDAEHVHTPLCYGTWVLTCDMEEHTHTGDCEPDAENTEVPEEGHQEEETIQADEKPQTEEMQDGEAMADIEAVDVQDSNANCAKDAYPIPTDADTSQVLQINQSGSTWQFGYYSEDEGYVSYNTQYYADGQWRMTMNSTGEANWAYGVYATEGQIYPAGGRDNAVTYTAPYAGSVSLSALDNTVWVDGASTDGIQIAIFKGNTQIWPSDGNWYVINASNQNQIAFSQIDSINVQKGDQLHFRINCNNSSQNDRTFWYPIVTYQTIENEGKLRDYLDDDWAYITDFHMKADETTTSGTMIRTGTGEWDADDEAGNDSSDTNNILRTFDTASYTLEFSTKLREALARQDVGGIKEGRLYFEFVLPQSREEARFETDSMGWLTSARNIKWENIDATVTVDGVAKTCQVLRGSFTLVSTGSNEAAIGASINELNVVLRAMKMHNGQTVQPLFTLWLQHNEVGAAYNQEDDRLPASIVTGTTYPCPTTDIYGSGETESHGVEAKTVTAPAITISARPMFNIELTGVSANNTMIGTFDFDDASSTAINYGCGSVEGRMNGYGIVLETRGKTGQGMRGMEFPDTEQPITFELKLSSAFQPENGSKTEDDAYMPLFWAGDSNNGVAQCGDRTVAMKNLEACEIPAGAGTSYHNVQSLGSWRFEATDDPSVVRVTVTGLAFGPQFPYGGYGIQDTFYKYYNPQTVGENWWQIERAVFGVGRVFVVQPFYDGNGLYVCDKYDANGQFYTSVSDQNMTMYAQSAGGGQLVTKQEVTDDDVRNQGQYLKRPGNIDGYVQYNKYNGQYFEPVSAGAFQNDSDWATAGSKIMLQIEMEHDNAEGNYVGVACDNLLKWDDTFFEPEADGLRFSADGIEAGRTLWGAKSDRTGWTDDEEMKRCTADDLVYFNSLTELEEAGYVPVGILFESRTVLSEGAYNHLHYFLNGKIKEDCPTGEVYMIVRNSYAWRKLDVADAALAYYNAQHPDAPKSNTEQLTNDDYNDYTKNALISHVPGSANEGKYYANGGTELSGSYPKPFWYHDYNHTSNRGSAENPGTSEVSECAAATKASYPGGVYQSGQGSLYYQDSCLVIGFTTSVNKQTAQSEQSTPGTPKTNYDMDQNQRTVDYELNVRLDRSTYTPDASTGAKLKTVVYVEDTLPKELTLVAGTARLGGTYTQDALHQSPGTVTGGQAFESTAAAGVNKPNDAHPYLETVTYNEDGTTTVLWMFPVELDLNETYWTQPIRFSCAIGTPGVSDTDVTNGQSINNTAKVWADGDDQRSFNPEYGNMDTFGITVSKMNAVSISKVSDLLVGEKWDDLGFTMNVGNNSSNSKSNTIVAETLPYNGLHRSSFNGRLNVKEFSAAVVNGSGGLENSTFRFYYTTDTQYAGKLGSDYQTYLEAYREENPGASFGDWAEAKGWTALTFKSTPDPVNGMTLYSADNLPDLTAGQITAIVGSGDLPANTTLKMHVTLTLPEGQAGDYLVNYLSQDKLSSYARTQVVSRSLEGLTWLDVNGDGLQNEAESSRISGVKVSLYWLQNGEYVPYCYPETQTPVSVETGQMVSVLTGETQTYETGRYKFTDLPAGTFAVRFESGSRDISGYIASPVNRGGKDDTIDSDGVPTYSNDKSKLEYTWIDSIVMKPAVELTYGMEESKYHDSGFYERGAELPETGGPGILPYTAGGTLLLAAALILLHNESKRRREGRKPS